MSPSNLKLTRGERALVRILTLAGRKTHGASARPTRAETHDNVGGGG